MGADCVSHLGRVACPHADLCAGCPLLELSYAEQLARKGERVRTALHRYDTLSHVRVAEAARAEPFTGYRVRAKLMVAPGPRVGLYAKEEDHEVVDIPDCRVLAPSLSRAAAGIRALLAAPPAEAGAALVPREAGLGALTAVDLRQVARSDGLDAGVLVTLVLDQSRAVSTEALAVAASALREAVPNAVGLAVNLHAPEAAQVLGPTTRVLWGADAARDRAGQAYALASYGAFVQAHEGQAEAIGRHVVVALAEHGALAGANVLDVYGGSGALGLRIARAGGHVRLIESFGPAAEGAARAAREQRLAGRAGSLEALVADAAEGLEQVARSGTGVDAIVVDPPRRGIGPSARLAIARLRPKVVVYVSCSPDTLARDLDHFARLGLHCTEVHPYDLIPLTDHVETVAVLERGEAARAPVLYEDDEWRVVGKGPHEPVTRQPGYPICTVERAGASDVATPIYPLEARGSGLLLFRRRSSQAGEPLRPVQVELHHRALVRGMPASRGLLRCSFGGRGVRRAHFERLERVGHHAIVDVRSEPMPAEVLRAALAKMGHPVIGDARTGDAATNRHVAEKYGLDRPFWHCVQVDIYIVTPSSPHPEDGVARPDRSFSLPLSADLERVRERLLERPTRARRTKA